MVGQSGGCRKAPAGEDRGFCSLPVCRSDRPIRIVGGHNDAGFKMPEFYRNCKSVSTKLTTNCINPAGVVDQQAPRTEHGISHYNDNRRGSHNEIDGM